MKHLKISLLCSAAVCATQVTAQEIQYSTHLPPSVLVMEGVQMVFDAVSEETGGAVTPKYFWAGQLHGADGNFNSVAEGVIDAAFTQPASNQAEMRRNLIFSDLWHLGDDPYVTAAALNETILLDCPSCQAEYASYNTIFLGAHAGTPANLVCSDEITSMDELQGKKINGLPALGGWLDVLGAARVSVPPPRQLEALQRNELDCTFISPEWLSAFSISEAAGTIVPVSTGSQFATSMMTTNLDTWNGYSAEVRAAFLDAMPEAIAAVVSGYVARDVEAMDAATASGIPLVTFDGAYSAKLAEYLVGYEDRVIAAAEQRGVDNASEIVGAFLANLEKWQGIIAEQGTDNYAQLLKDEIYSQIGQ